MPKIKITFPRDMAIAEALIKPSNYVVALVPDAVQPKLTALEVLDERTLKLTFDKILEVNAALANPVNYAIEQLTGGFAYTVEALSATEVQVTFDTDMDSETLELTGNYVVEAIAGSGENTFSVAISSPTELILTYALAMTVNPDLYDPANYAISGELALITGAVSYWNFQDNWNDIIGGNHWYEGAGWEDEKEGCYFATAGGINGKYYAGSEAMIVDLCQLNKSSLAPAHITVSMWTSGYDDPYGDGPGWGPFTATLFKKGHAFNNPPTNCVYGLYMPAINSVTPEIRWGVNTAGGWDALSHTMLSTWVGWHHYVGTYDGVTLKLYINGVLVAEKVHAYGGDILDSADAEYWRYTSHLSDIDMAGVWDRTLGLQNVIELYNGGTGRSTLG